MNKLIVLFAILAVVANAADCTITTFSENGSCDNEVDGCYKAG